MINTEQLKREAAAFNIEIAPHQAEQFDCYASMLVEKNKVMNLTGITSPDGIVTRHFADSLSFFSAANPEIGSSLIDVGSGAGFPGLAIKIIRPDMEIALLDSTAKRVSFLKKTAEKLGLSVNCLHARAEEKAQDTAFREKFDFATARAVSELRVLSEYCLGFVKPNGHFIALKGKDVAQELADAENAITTLGGKTENVLSLNLTDSSARNIVLIKKISHTPSKYPRVSAQIAKKPL